MFCPKCGKEISRDAHLCTYCGTSVDEVRNDSEGEETKTVSDTAEPEAGRKDEYSNCKNGKISFSKMIGKLLSKGIMEYFSFKGTYSRLECFYASLIFCSILLALLHILTILPLQERVSINSMLIVSVSLLWSVLASVVKRVKDIGVTVWIILIPLVCNGIVAEYDKDPIGIAANVIENLCTMYIIFWPGKKFKKEETIKSA